MYLHNEIFKCYILFKMPADNKAIDTSQTSIARYPTLKGEKVSARSDRTKRRSFQNISNKQQQLNFT